MKTFRYSYLALLLTLFSVSLHAQQHNALQVPDVTMQIGAVQLPVAIENTDEIVAAQFDLTLPDGITAATEGTMTNRADGHSVTVSQLSSGVYRVLIHSVQNRPLKGQSGVVMYLPINIPDSFEEDSEHSVAIGGAVLGKATGENALTETVAGKIRIAKLPDLTVSSITATAADGSATITPGGRIVCSWQVKNSGGLTTGGGWSEQLSLVSADGTKSKLIATTRYDGILEAQSTVSRQAEVTVPLLLGLDGTASLQVRIVPDGNTGESASGQGNNTLTTAPSLTVSKMLRLTLSREYADEADSPILSCKLSRSGDTGSSQAFSLSVTGDPRVALSAGEATIPAGKTSVVFYINIADDQALQSQDTTAVVLTASGDGYESTAATFYVVDDELKALTLTSSTAEVEEGTTFQLTVTKAKALAYPLTVNLACEYTKRFSCPSTIVIPQGATSATVDVTAKDNDDIELQTSVAFQASADRHESAQCLVLLSDNDMPVISMTLSPSSVSESAGPSAIIATITRTTATDKVVTLKLSDDSDGTLYYANKTLTMDKGVKELRFSIGVVNNSLVDGDRTVNFTAAVYAASCSCSASGESKGWVTQPITIIDDDGPALKLTAASASWLEGSAGNLLTLSRNTATTEAVTIRITSDKETMLDYEHQVTIAAGEQSVAVPVNVKSNDATGDNSIVTLTATGDGFAQGTCWVQITDQTLPDATIAALTSTVSEVEAGGKLPLTLRIANIGNSSLPAQMPVAITFSGNGSTTTFFTQQSIAPGDTLELQKELLLPTIVGSYTITAIANNSNAIKELITVNNVSAQLPITLLPSFTATAQVDKTTLQPGDNITISGQVSGAKAANTEVEVYIINDGLRQTQTVTADSQGAYSLTWTPYAQQMGRFVVGACFPGEGLTTAMASFDVYGMHLSSFYSTCKVDYGSTYSGTFTITNSGSLSLTGLTASLAVSDAAVTLTSVPTQIAAGATATVSYTISGDVVSTGNKWREVPINIQTAEGPSATYNINYFVYSLKGMLNPGETSVRTTMVKGKSRDYPITLTNSGKGETGKITIDPGNARWLSTATPTEMASLKSGETTTAILRFTPTDDMQLNNPVHCNLSISMENGDGSVIIPLTVEPVSEATGTLTIDVCDENTYYTTLAPHVEGATVNILHPITHAVVQTAMSGTDGRCSFTLPEGYYYVEVTEPKHKSYTNNIMVHPGTETVKTVNIGINGVKIDMRYEKTEIEDEYELVTTATYETNVPIPVVETIVPQRIPADELGDGESLLFNAVLTNKGLVTAQNTQFLLPESSDEFELTLLGSEAGIDLAPQQSVVIPVKVTRHLVSASRGQRRAEGKSHTECYIVPITYYESYCGDDNQIKSEPHPIQLKVCVPVSDHPVVPTTPIPPMITILPTPPTVPTTYPITDPPAPLPTIDFDPDIIASKIEQMVCDPCVNEKMRQLAECLDFDPDHPFQSIIKEISSDAVGCVIDIGNCITDNSWLSYDDCGSNLLGCLLKACQAIGGALVATGAATASTGAGAGVATVGGAMKGFCKVMEEVKDGAEAFECWYELLQPCPEVPNGSLSRASRKSVEAPANNLPSYITQFQEKMKIGIDGHDASIVILRELMGYDVIRHADIAEVYALMRKIAETKKGEMLSAEALEAYRPTEVKQADFAAFIQRLNNTTLVEQGKPFEGDYINKERLDSCRQVIENCNEQVRNLGYETVSAMIRDAMDQLEAGVQNERNSICSSITLKLSQKLTMTRQAIRGTLTVYNGHDTATMEEVKLSLVVHDEDGTIVGRNIMELRPETLKGFTGELSLSSGWTLEAGQEGEATVLFIPTRHAAPTATKSYTFSGTISYIDPFSQLEVTRDLASVTLTVEPSPVLDLTYFLQRDVLGDDPLTEEVEPMKPAEFSLLINNKGYGDAKNVRMVTWQPQTEANEKGLANKLTIKSSQLNGTVYDLTLDEASINNVFGTIPAHSQAYAQWWLTSELTGHFTTYDVKATHVNANGNDSLSLLDEVTIHELIHSLEVEQDGKSLRAFLVNDNEDVEDTPDSLYLTNGERSGVAAATLAETEKLSATTCKITVTPSDIGWNYGNVMDPTFGRSAVKSVVRQSDGKSLPVDNFWQTDRTLRDSKEPLYENRLHFADRFESLNAVSYIVTYEPTPIQQLEVATIDGIPEEGQLAVEPVTAVTVTFNKPVSPATFTADDLTFAVQGVKQDAAKIGISTEDNQTFTLNFSALTGEIGNGYRTLTVQTAGITDTEGFTGKTGKSVGWVMFRGGLVQLLTSAYPVEAGTVARQGTPAGVRSLAPATADATAVYGSQVTLVATPKEGYEFSKWTLNGEDFSTEQELTMTALGNMDVVANFKKKTFSVEVVADAAQGRVIGLSTGIYSYGTSAELSVVPTADYELDYWLVDGERQSANATLTLTVSKATTVEAVFRQAYYQQSLTLSKGWNWVSAYLSEPLALSDLSPYVYRVVSQTDELINDPQYGLVGGIRELTAGQTFKIEALSRSTSTFRGHLYDAEAAPVGLHKGWNWIAYPNRENTSLTTVVNAEEGDFIVSQKGFAEFGDGAWEGSLDTFTPGDGYLYKSVSDKELTFNFTQVSCSRSWRSVMLTVQDNDIDIHRYPNTMNMTVQVVGDGMTLANDDLAVYVMTGDELRGIGQQVGSRHYLTVYGDGPDEVTFLVEQKSTGILHAVKETMKFRNDVVGSRKDPFILTLSGTVGIGGILEGTSEPMTVYDLQGRKLTNSFLGNRRLQKGVYVIGGHKRFVK